MTRQIDKAGRSGAVQSWNADARRALRLTVELEVALSGSQVGRQKSELCDLSELGCRVTCPSSYSVETPVLVTIPGLAPIGTRVRWSTVEHLGLKFNTPLHPLVAARIVAMGKADPATQGPETAVAEG